jgi:hypothetical protein
MAMSNSVYSINKGINRPIEFKGLKAQYIWYLAGGLLALLILFAILYICGLHPFALVLLVLLFGTCWFLYVYRLSNRYGEYGMMKKVARRGIPKVLKARDRKMFLN